MSKFPKVREPDIVQEDSEVTYADIDVTVKYIYAQGGGISPVATPSHEMLDLIQEDIKNGYITLEEYKKSMMITVKNGEDKN